MFLTAIQGGSYLKGLSVMYEGPKSSLLERTETTLEVSLFLVSQLGGSGLRSYGIVIIMDLRVWSFSGCLYLHPCVWCVGLRIKASQAYCDFLMIRQVVSSTR